MWVVGADLQKFTDMRREARCRGQPGGERHRAAESCSAAWRGRPLWCAAGWEGSSSPRRTAAHPSWRTTASSSAREAEKGRHMLDTSAEAPGPDAGLRGRRLDRPAGLRLLRTAPRTEKEYTLTQLRAIHSPDKALRKAAFEAELACSRASRGMACPQRRQRST